MVDSRKPGESSPTKSGWQDKEGEAEILGVTRVFGTTSSTSIDPSPSSNEPFIPAENATEGPGEIHGRKELQEPIVHKIVLGGSSAISPTDMFERLRTSSSEGEPAIDPVLPEAIAGSRNVPGAASPSHTGFLPGQSGEGLTQLLRALNGDSSSTSHAKDPDLVRRTLPSSAPREEHSESGFTALLSTQIADEGNRQPDRHAPSPGVSSSDGTGGFTALLLGLSGKPRSILPEESPDAHPADAPEYALEKAAPGAFTQLISALKPEPTISGATETHTKNSSNTSVSAIHSEHNSVTRPSGEEESFTQLISEVGGSRSRGWIDSDNRLPISEESQRRQLPELNDPLRSNPLPLGSGGLTQLLRALDEPAKGPEIPDSYPGVGTPTASPGSGSLFTQTYKKLDESVEPLSPVLQTSYSPASQPVVSGGTLPDLGPGAPVAPKGPVGPSDVTRIIDASKLREMQRQAMSAPEPINHVTQAELLPAQLSVPAQPTPPTAAAGRQPQNPPPAVQAAPAPAAPALMSKMQKYVPLMLLTIIFLLMVILVTVAFLMKH